MKQVLALGLFALTALLLPACPIFESASCFDSSDCRTGEYCGSDGLCHVAPFDPGGSGGPKACAKPSDCGTNQTCGSDFRCHPGDCSAERTGCVSGYECVPSESFGHVCVPESDAGIPDGGATEPVYCGSPADCSSGSTCAADGICQEGDCGTHPCVNGFVCKAGATGPTCVRGNPAACGSDDDCEGQACIDGICTASSLLCSDATQCPTSAHSCVEGRCTKRCATSGQCPNGSACDTDLGVCTKAGLGCETTSDCKSAEHVCVGHACVNRCGVGGTCNIGFVCVDNGCVPRAGIVSECDIDGQESGCGTGRICLRHHCYRSCDAPNESACDAEAVFKTCKEVTTSSGTHAVCGSAENLGDECDLAMGRRCAAGSVCIDGFCKP